MGSKVSQWASCASGQLGQARAIGTDRGTIKADCLGANVETKTTMPAGNVDWQAFGTGDWKKVMIGLGGARCRSRYEVQNSGGIADWVNGSTAQRRGHASSRLRFFRTSGQEGPRVG